MNSNGPADPPKDDNPESPNGQTPERPRKTFGHKGMQGPWESQRPKADSGLPIPRSSHTSDPDTDRSAPAPVPHPQTPGEDDDDDALTRLHPNYKLLMRFGAIIGALVITVIGIVLDFVARNELGFPFGLIMVPAILIALFIAIRVPLARYNARGYNMSVDRLRVVRGVLFRSDTIVPFGRVQHIDVDQSPIERMLDIATMTLHTAGSHNASVRLPGLGHKLAVEMREEIRAHIKRESM